MADFPLLLPAEKVNLVHLTLLAGKRPNIVKMHFVLTQQTPCSPTGKSST